MATIKDVVRALDDFAPFSTQMSFDNAGFLVGRGEVEVTKILVSLDIALPVVEEAVALGANLIVSHHPVIFHPAKTMVSGDPVGDILLTLAEERIAAICAHTNLDLAVGGVNDALARSVGLEDIQVLLPEAQVDGEGRPYGLGRMGTLPQPMPLREYALQVKSALGAAGVRCVDGGKPIRRVAVGGGACGDCLSDAYKQGCDLLITSDVKYNTFLDAQAMGVSLMDAGHFPTENVVLPGLIALLETAFPALAVVPSQVHREVYFCL